MTHILHHYQAADVQQVSRLIATHGQVLTAIRFHQVNFSQQSLVGMTFQQCEFVECSFIEADLSGVHFSECVFVSTPTPCDFSKSNLSGALFQQCDLSHTVWRDVEAIGLRLESCQLSHMVLSNAVFAGTATAQSQLTLRQCDCQGMELSHLVIDGVNLTGCQLRDIKVNQVVMSHCNFAGSLVNACEAVDWDLSYSDLREADVLHLNQATTQLAGAYVNEYQAKTLNLTSVVRIA
ncbi:pentapeptide repeat-containing protein [Vibrio porteresiae]|uniref:Pentapeptide repeat-containing protein n=1 Tax=Vibrio porteresiae DSM 19223 TaxID=1123496 RepID=A0ABZ0QG82_9VIBR|nr:pentapeptide repeat-containing protein [Vibrio porteresiae]WPC75488.1 pentapeptide repeat-containing protein [Vibrio porteresiae DSM 19223]